MFTQLLTIKFKMLNGKEIQSSYSDLFSIQKKLMSKERKDSRGLSIKYWGLLKVQEVSSLAMRRLEFDFPTRFLSQVSLIDPSISITFFENAALYRKLTVVID